MNVIAVDVGASNLRGAIISKTGRVIKCLKFKTPRKGKSGRVLTNRVIDLIKELLKDFPKKKIRGISIASIGPLNQKGEIIRSSNLSFKRVPLKEPLRKYFALPLIIHNDCTAAVWGEKVFGAGKKYQNLVYVSLSSGIGGGAVVNNHLLTGRNNAAEIGHFNVETEYRLPCSCKKGVGHWQAYCSGRGLPLFLKHWMKKKKIKRRVPSVASLNWLNKDKSLKLFIKEINRINGLGFSNVIAAYDPEIITLGGGMILPAKNRPVILSGIKRNVDKFLPLPKIIITPLKDKIVLYGAAALFFYPAK